MVIIFIYEMYASANMHNLPLVNALLISPVLILIAHSTNY